MLAVHVENLLFLLLLVVAGLFQLLGRVARKVSGDAAKPTSKPVPRTPKLIPRASAESDEERIRKFLEALGQPAASRPPPPVVPRTDIPPRRLAPVQPPTAQLPRAWRLPQEQGRKPDITQKQSPPPETARRADKIVPPPAPPAPAFEVHEGPVPIELQLPPIIKTPVEGYAAATRSLAKGADFRTDIAAVLASKSGLRDAIILREIFGPPRSLQPLDLVGNT
jgi:hypothetical protein